MPTSVFILDALCGFAGGVVGSHLTAVYAQGPGSGAEIIHNKSFVLVDNAGHKRGEWVIDSTGASSGRAVLRMFDANGHLVWDSLGTARPQLTK